MSRNCGCTSISKNLKDRSRYLSDRNPKIYYAEGGIPITTLFVVMRNGVTHKDLLDHFSTFGDVRRVEIHQSHFIQYLAHIVFYYGESAAKALVDKYHTICGFRLRVGIAEYEDQEHPVDIPMDLSIVTGKQLMDLNDECLEKIFSLNFISISDLCAVARTNHRLKNIANRIFSLKHQVCNRRVIITFGFLISDLWIGEDYNYGEWWMQWNIEEWINLLKLVVGCCSKTLDTLQLDQCLIPKSLTTRLKMLFSNLEKHCLFDCVFLASDNELFADCKNLIELTVSGDNTGENSNVVQDMRFVMDHVFPKLEKFHYDDGDCLDLAIFLSQHKNLKSLKISGCADSFSLIPVIAHNCKQLEELEFDFTIPLDGAEKFEKVIESLQMLDHLRTMTMNCVEENVTEFISKLNSLKAPEFLELWDVATDSKFISALSQLKGLKVLKLMDCEELGNLNQLGDLHQLTKLSLYSNDHIDLDIVLLVKRLNSLRMLYIDVQTYELDKKMYVNLVTVVRSRSIKSQQNLEITCYTADDAAADLQNVGDNRQIVKLRVGVKGVKL